MKPSRSTRQRRIELYTKQAAEYEAGSADWHYYMQYVEHWRRVYQRGE